MTEPRHPSPNVQGPALGPKPVLIVCYSRCLYCGRRTPHEVCRHEPCHRDVDIGWSDFDAPPEMCPEGCDPYAE